MINERRYDIDVLRVFAVYLLFLFHTVMIFNPAPFYHVRNDEQSIVMLIVAGFISLWHMPLLFVLAGWSIVASLREKAGLDRIYIAMHIYKEPVEPEVGNERIALARLLSRGIPYIDAGPDVWAPTRATFPDSFSDDQLHPNETGMKIMAEGWYRTLAGRSARESVIQSMWETDYDIETMMRAYLAWRRGE